MKFIFIIVSLFIFSINALNTRDVLSEELALEIEYLGSCKEFYQKVFPTIWVNRHQPCLPIQFNVTNNPDNNDLNTDLFCTNSDERRSIIHFAEIYDTVQTTKEPNFIVSLISSAPFRVLTIKTTVNRRPNCFVTNDYCNADNAIVNDCTTNEVTYRRRHVDNKRPGDRYDGNRRPGFDGDRFEGDIFGKSVRNLPGDKNDGDHFQYSEQKRRGWIVNQDRIYIVSNQQVTNDCKTSITECCNYITPALYGGICNNLASIVLLDFPKEINHNKPSNKQNNYKYRPNRPDGNRFDRPDGNRFDRPDGNRFDRPIESEGKRPEEPVKTETVVAAPVRTETVVAAPVRTETVVAAPVVTETVAVPLVQTQRVTIVKPQRVTAIKHKKAHAKIKVVVQPQSEEVEVEEREEPEQEQEEEQEEETNEEEEENKK